MLFAEGAKAIDRGKIGSIGKSAFIPICKAGMKADNMKAITITRKYRFVDGELYC